MEEELGGGDDDSWRHLLCWDGRLVAGNRRTEAFTRRSISGYGILLLDLGFIEQSRGMVA